MATSEGTSSDFVQNGWADLARGRWQQARYSFRQAVDAAPSPRAYEGLSWAAWWLDDAEELFEARRQAYLLYRQAGDPAAAARMAVWLAADEADFHGAGAVAQGWFRRAHRLLDPLEPGPDHGWLAFHEGFFTGDPAQMRAGGARAVELGARHDLPDLQMLGLALQGSALVADAQVPDGMRLLDEATAMALEGRSSIPISRAWAFCFLVSACISVMDFERAVQWCDRIADFAERYQSRYMMGFCGAEYGDVNMWRGRWSEAERALSQSISDFGASRPAWVEEPRVRLAELRRRQGRRSEALDLLDGLSSLPAQVCRGWLSLDAGEHLRSIELAERVLRQIPAQRLTGLVPVLELLVEARLAAGDPEGADQALHGLEKAVERIDTLPVRGLFKRLEGMLALARQELDRARQLLEDAVDAFERSQAAYECARSRAYLASSLVALGRLQDADREASSASAAFEAMGAGPEADRARGLVAHAQKRAGRTDSAQPLTRREQQVLRLVAEGRTNREIAAELVVSEHTVHRHVANILRKLEVPSRTAAATWAARSGGAPP